MGRWKDKYIIGLTGNIATGKSLVRRMLEHLGAYTIDADGLTHQVIAPNAPAYKPVTEMFGRFVVQSDGQIDRNRLGAIVFSHTDALQILESITHPIIASAIDTLITRARHKVIVVEAIKLIESDLAGMVDTVWVVDSSPEQQYKRLVEKRGINQLEARKRITIQNPQADKLAKADFVIKNNGTPDQTWTQVQAGWSMIANSQESTAAVEAVRRVEVQQKPATPLPPTPPPPSIPEQPAVPAPPPVSTTPAAPPQEAAPAISSFTVKRPRPSDFDKIASLINGVTGSALTSGDIMASFGEKTYLLAETETQPLGVISFVVENLVTRVDSFIISGSAPLEDVGKSLIEEMESASGDLQSEIAFVFLPKGQTRQKAVFLEMGYEEINAAEVRYPAWREAVSEALKENVDLLSKRLRESLVLKPI